MLNPSPQQIAAVAQEMDPQPFMAALNQPQAGAMMPPAQPQADFNSVLNGGAPGGAGMPGGAMGMMGLMNMMNSKPAAPHLAPAVQPPKPGQMQMPAMPHVGQVPDLATILGRR